MREILESGKVHPHAHSFLLLKTIYSEQKGRFTCNQFFLTKEESRRGPKAGLKLKNFVEEQAGNQRRKGCLWASSSALRPPEEKQRYRGKAALPRPELGEGRGRKKNGRLGFPSCPRRRSRIWPPDLSFLLRKVKSPQVRKKEGVFPMKN